jgi:hypothetical protein
LRWLLQCVSLQFACLITFSWMQSQRAIERLWSGFHEPETSHAHTEMLWHGYFHESTVDRSFWQASRDLWLCLRCSAWGAKPILRDKHTHAIRGFWHILLATVSFFARLEDLHALRT